MAKLHLAKELYDIIYGPIWPVELYKDETDVGTMGNIQLSDSVANYKYIEIYFKAYELQNFTKIYNANNKETELYASRFASTYYYSFVKKITFHDNQIIVNHDRNIRHFDNQFGFGGSDGHDYDAAATGIYITRVLGYKYDIG